MLKRGLIVSDFNADTLASYLNNESQSPKVTCQAAPFGQVEQILLDAAAPAWNEALDFCIIWTLPERALPSFRSLQAGVRIDHSTLLAEVDLYVDAVLGASKRASVTFIPTWIFPTFRARRGMLDLSRDFGIARALAAANSRLIEKLESARGIILLNASRWLETIGEKSFNARLWYSAKIPFSNELLKLATADLKSAIRGLSGLSRKVIVLDLDDTLWGGIVGDTGWENLKLGGHDPVGEAFVDFQLELKALARSGVILALASKNTESVALQAIDQHPEMVLRRKDFSAWRINWNDKARNIEELVAELNLGLESVVFLDDNPVERARVRETLPAVFVPELPVDKRLYVETLRQLDCFNRAAVTEEDARRQDLYALERQRIESRTQAGSVDEWLITLGTVVRIEPINRTNLQRVVQLLNKTNQMNLSTRRLTEQEFTSWLAGENRHGWALHVSDRFGDSGLTGLLTIEPRTREAVITDFILSCRVMGRKIEEAMLHVAVDWAQAHGHCTTVAEYSKTYKNQPCLAFFERSGFAGEDQRTFTWNNSSPFPLPASVSLAKSLGATHGMIPSPVASIATVASLHE